MVLARITHWLHSRWPAGVPEPMPVVGEDGSTNLPGVFVAGDLTGVPLLKFAIETGVKSVERIAGRPDPGNVDADVIIVGAGLAGVAAAIEAKRQGLSYKLIEGSGLFSTIQNFPARKPIFTYPNDMTPAGDLQVSADVKEELLSELMEQATQHGITSTTDRISHVTIEGGVPTAHGGNGVTYKARGIVIAIGRSGNFRKLGVSGEDLPIVSNRLHDPKEFAGKKVTVIGGGDSAVEAAIALAESGASLTFSYRKADLTRPKEENRDRLIELAEAGQVQLLLGSQATEITERSITLDTKGQGSSTIETDGVLVLIGREPPLDFFRRSGIPIRGEKTPVFWVTLSLFFGFVTLLYGMKTLKWFEGTAFHPAAWFGSLSEIVAGSPILMILVNGLMSPSFWVTFLYSACVVGFGIARIKRRKTPYITLQTLTLMAIQVFPLFILPEIVFPLMDTYGWMPYVIKENLFPLGYWQAYGFILAWPLMVWNIFTDQPYLWWLIIGGLQTFVIIPLIVLRWGKGAYCGWICSCGALAETMGDKHREKMPHGAMWNKANMLGQIILWIAFVMLAWRIVGWATYTPIYADSAGNMPPHPTLNYISLAFNSIALNGFWKVFVDFFLAGALGVGLYFHFSGRVWCRFACPLAAWMHIWARIGQFRIIADKKKCISCNACTTTCHQGIDVMAFANKGQPMADPECVRCSACVQTCPTGVLQFGRVDGQDKVIGLDTLVASPVQMKEKQKAS